MLRNEDLKQPNLEKSSPALSQEKSKTFTILEKIYKSDEQKPAITAKEKILKNANIIKALVDNLDTESITSLQQANRTLFSTTKTVAMRNILWYRDEKDQKEKKTLSNLDSRHVIATGRKLIAGIINDMPIPRERSFELLSGDLKKVLEYKSPDDSDDENDVRIYMKQAYSIILSGNAHTFSEFLKIHPINTDKLHLVIAYFYMQLAVLSGEIPMVITVRSWLGDLNRLKDNKPESVDSDDEDEDSKSTDRYTNMNYLIFPAIASHNKFMLDHVTENFIDEKLKEVTPDFANRCLQEAFATNHEEIKNKLIRNVKFLPLFDLAKVAKEDNSSKLNDHILTSLKKMCIKSSLDEMKSDHHYFLKKPLTLNAEKTIELYRSCLHREDKFREEMIKKYHLTDCKTDSDLFYGLVKNEIKSIQHLKHIMKDFKLDAKSWISHKNRPYERNLSIADISAAEGAQETLEYALKELQVPVDLNALYKLKETNYGLLYYAVESADPKLFQFVMRFLLEHKDFDAQKVRWDLVVSHGIYVCDRKPQNIAILHCLKDYIEYFKQEYNSELSIEKLFLSSINSIHGELSVIKFYCEALGLASHMDRIEHNHVVKDSDCMLSALNYKRLDTVRYLVETARYNIVKHVDRIMQEIIDNWRPIEYIQEDKNILGYLINKGMPITQQQFEQFKDKCKSDHTKYSMTPEAFEKEYGQVFNDLAKTIDAHKSVHVQIAMKK